MIMVYKNNPGGVTNPPRAKNNKLLFNALGVCKTINIHSNLIFEPVSFKIHSPK